PSANFTFSPSTPAIGDTVVFDWRTSTVPQGQRIVALDWNFGDSTPIVHCPGDAACTADGITTHVFTASGTFAVNLVVTDSAGRTGVVSKSVTVSSGAPTAVFSPAEIDPVTHTMRFDASASTAAGGATIVSYQWSFGDGAFSTVMVTPTTIHSYAGTGGAGT